MTTPEERIALVRQARLEAIDNANRRGRDRSDELLWKMADVLEAALRQSPETRDIERGAAAIFEAIPDDCELVRGLDPTFRAEEICTILARACLASVSTPSPEGPRDEEIEVPRGLLELCLGIVEEVQKHWQTSSNFDDDVKLAHGQLRTALSRPSEIEKS